MNVVLIVSLASTVLAIVVASLNYAYWRKTKAEIEIRDLRVGTQGHALTSSDPLAIDLADLGDQIGASKSIDVTRVDVLASRTARLVVRVTPAHGDPFVAKIADAAFPGALQGHDGGSDTL